jgi:hypothetical protein
MRGATYSHSCGTFFIVKEHFAGAEYNIWTMTKRWRTALLAIITVRISYTRKARSVVINVTVFQVLIDVL